MHVPGPSAAFTPLLEILVFSWGWSYSSAEVGSKSTIIEVRTKLIAKSQEGNKGKHTIKVKFVGIFFFHLVQNFFRVCDKNEQQQRKKVRTIFIITETHKT